MNRSRRTFLGVICATFIGASTGCVSSSEGTEESDGNTDVTGKVGVPASTGTTRGGGAETPAEAGVRTDARPNESVETTSIVVAKSGDEVAMTANVPVKWEKQSKKAERVEKLVERKYSDLPGYRDAYIVNAKKSIQGHHYSAVEVAGTKDHIDSLRDAIPIRIRGVRVKIALYHEAVAA